MRYYLLTTFLTGKTIGYSDGIENIENLEDLGAQLRKYTSPEKVVQIRLKSLGSRAL